MAISDAQVSQAAGIDTPWLTPREMRTLEAVCEGLIPSVYPPIGEDDRYGLYARSARDLGVAALMAGTLAAEPPDARADFKRLLRLLDSPLFMLPLAGQLRPFVQLPPIAREAALRRMSTGRIAQLRQGFAVLKRLSMFIFYAAPLGGGENPNWPAIGYVPTRPRESAPKSIRTVSVARDLTIAADAVVVGSGAGGGVMAAELAAAGQDVVVLEKGGYYNESDFTGVEAEMTPKLYLRRGLLSTHDLGMVVLAGSCVGGGTVVNWSTSLRTPAQVLDEWQRLHGLSGLAGPDYERGLDSIEARLGVTTEDSGPNRNNAALLRGCEALGYRWRPIPRNASGCRQRCGACGFGCPYGCKRSTMLTFLQDASDAGARVIPGCDVRRVLIEAGRAVGVEGRVFDAESRTWRRLVVRAPRVIVAAGAVESPALLMRSGLTNPNIGRHLRLHPVAAMQAEYEEPIEPWTGSLQTVLCDQFADLQDGYGLRIEMAPPHPGLIGLVTPWDSGQAHKQAMARAAHTAAFIVLARDTGEGRVTLDRQGDPVLRYWPNETDRRRLIRGMQEVVRIAFAGGAVRAATLHSPTLALDAESRRPGAVSEGRMSEFLAQIERRGIQLNRLPLFSAHQMGTCRLGGDPGTSVAGPDGETHEARNLFIADASGFPTAPGVNPMISTMGLAYHVAQHIKVSA